MPMSIIGIGFALLALLCWGFGDFFIQRTSRDFGIWPSLFCITGTGAVALFPFAFKHLGIMFSGSQIWFLLLVSVITLLVALLEFKALKVGKISVIEPILSFELPLTVLLSVIALSENLNSLQMILIAFVFGGILLVGYTGEKIHARHMLEKGALLALGATVVMAFVNLTTGLASARVGPVAAIWFIHTFLAITCLGYFIITKSWHTFVQHVKRHPYESFWVAVCDNGAWIAYATAALLIPISLTITISESYIIVTILLGVIINKEKLMKHQWVGVMIS